MELLFVLSIVALIGQSTGIKFGSSYGTHMVLQRAPKRAMLYGYANVVGDSVTVYKNGASVGTAQVEKNLYKGLAGYWSMLLPAESHPGPFTITASSSDGNVTLTDVLFGDVWICSGQSNMYFKMSQVNNSTAEIENALHFTDVRMLVSNRITSTVEVEEANLLQHWTKPNKGHINGFSAVCFMFGRNLQSHLKYPIGLIETSWGGTPVEAWSSHDVLATCAHHGTRAINSHTPSALWNAMVTPFLKTTIKGAIWYQGESNTRHPAAYACQFPAMIADWRQKFNHGSRGQTDADFPFGFVQLAPNTNSSYVGGTPPLRWAQTANTGFVPNPKMPNTFMAVALDLPDFHSPYGSVGFIMVGAYSPLPVLPSVRILSALYFFNQYRNLDNILQLAPIRNSTVVGGFPAIRWAQTANTGYVPNPKMPNTFMAVALDLPDFHSPYGAIHPRFKQDVAARLTLGAQAVAYGEKGVAYQGPFPTGFHMDQHHHQLEIAFDKGTADMVFHNTTGFEICCDTTATSNCVHGHWHYASITQFYQSRVSVAAACTHGRHVAGVRYAWHTSPCVLRTCPLYGKTNYLPVPPFIKTGGFTSATGIIG